MTTFMIYLVQLWFLIGVTILLHNARSRVGLMPYFFMTVTLVVLLTFSTFINIRFQITPDIRLGISGHLFTPVILMSLIIVYIADGNRMAQLELAGIVGVNALTLILLGFVVAYLSLNLENIIPPAVGSDSLVFDIIFLRRRFASVVAFTGAMVVIAVVFQFLRNLSQHMPEWFAISFALLMALWTDSFLFFFISDLGLDRFFANFQNDLMGKTLASISVIIPLTWYLTQVVKKSSDYQDLSKRPIFAILFGTSGRLNTAIKRLQSELSVSRRIYEELTEHIGEIFWLADVQTQKLIYISPAFEQLTGYRATDFYSHVSNMQKIVHPDDLDTQVMSRWIQPQANEFRIIRADGEIRWMRNHTFLIEDANGEVYRYAGVIEDFTERKNARQRDFDLALERERVKTLHSFIRDASHDLKSPLSAILLKIDMLEHYSDETHRTKISDELRDRVRRLSAQIDDLFTLSPIEGEDGNPKTVGGFIDLLFEGKDKTPKIAINFSDLVRESVDEFLPLAEEKGLNLSYETEVAECIVQANKGQLERMVGNLISNAIRYTEEGSIKLKIFTEDSVVKLEVSDSGIGIPKEDLANIFNRFYRSKNAKTFSGTGLGLAITKAIVDNHGGEIEVDSVLNEGSTFTITLSYLP